LQLGKNPGCQDYERRNNRAKEQSKLVTSWRKIESDAAGGKGTLRGENRVWENLIGAREAPAFPGGKGLFGEARGGNLVVKDAGNIVHKRSDTVA